ncbi:MAG: hypothetical protein ACM3JD_14285 [Rudaea sp.]
MARKTSARSRKGAPPVRRRDNNMLLIGGGIVAVVLVAILVYVNVSSGTTPTAGPTNATGRTWGSETAKVTVDEWSDFQ